MNEKLLNDEAAYLKPILRILQDNGGSIGKITELDQFFPKYSDLTAEEVNFERISKKTGNIWRPFVWRRNFATRNLEMTGFLTWQRGGMVELTQKGLNTDIDALDLQKDIYDITLPMWQEKSAANRRKRQAREKNDQADADTPGKDASDEDFADDAWRAEILAKIKALDPFRFEQFARGLLASMGFELDRNLGVSKSGDGGLDGFGYCVDNQSLRLSKVALQCKRFTKNQPVGAPDIQKLKGAIADHSADYGVFITTSYFSDGAMESARTGNVAVTLIDGEKLVDLMIKNGYKVREVKIYVPDEKFFGEE